MRSIIFLSLLAFLVTGPSTLAKEFRLYYLGGQSNMDGYGKVSELPEDLKAGKGCEGVHIFHGNMGLDGKKPDGRGAWMQLRPGHGRDFKSDGSRHSYSDRFGLELTLARTLKKQYPGAHIAFIKYSRGGTAIDSKAGAQKRFGAWDPDWNGGEGEGRGINQYDHFQATLKYAFADKDLDDDGESDILVPSGIFWMQGESDADSEEVARRYESNLGELMNLIRKDLGETEKKIPVVIGRITNWKVWKFGGIVREAQASFVRKDGRSALVTSTDSYKNSDPWHYDTAGYLDLGEQFAKAVISLEKSGKK
jgi:iduronate 2-sulfatase